MATFLLGGEPADWSSRWRLSLKIALGGVLLTMLPQLVPTWACVTVGIVASLIALPVFGGSWQGTQPHWVASGRVMPMFAGFPISYSEMSRLLMKVAVARFAAWAPFFVAYGTLVAWRAGMPVLDGIRIASLTLSVLIAFLPFVIAGQHSKGTSDTRRLNPQSIVAIPILIVLGLLFLSAAGLMFVGSTLMTLGARTVATLAGALGMFVCSGLAWRGYKLFYDRGRVDLVRPSNS